MNRCFRLRLGIEERDRNAKAPGSNLSDVSKYFL